MARYLRAYEVKYREMYNTSAPIQTKIIYANVADGAERKILELYRWNVTILKVTWIKGHTLLQRKDFNNLLSMFKNVS